MQFALKIGYLSVGYILKWVFASKASIILLGPASFPSVFKHNIVFAVTSTPGIKPGPKGTLVANFQIKVVDGRTKSYSTSLLLKRPGKKFYHFAQTRTL
jgi:hypothetical protein